MLFTGDGFDLMRTDAEFVRIFSSFAFEEVPRDVNIPQPEAALAVLAALVGANAPTVFSKLLPVALDQGVSALQVREMIYQGTAYLGIGRVYPFLLAFDELEASSVPLPETGTTNAENRVRLGEDVQIETFGDSMRGFAESGTDDVRHINRWLSGNCFGDYYTREGLNLRQREMCTFCFLAALGGCEPQLTSHAVGNMRVGNDQRYLISVISACVPYIGYPRSLNALRCVSQAALQYEKARAAERRSQ